MVSAENQDIVPILPRTEGWVAENDDLRAPRFADEGRDLVGYGAATRIIVGGDHDPEPCPT